MANIDCAVFVEYSVNPLSNALSARQHSLCHTIHRIIYFRTSFTINDLQPRPTLHLATPLQHYQTGRPPHGVSGRLRPGLAA
jgi:hypothetical protein